MNNAYQRPGAGELRKFGLLFGVFFILVFGIIIPVLGKGFGAMWSDMSLWPWATGGLVIVWALTHPATLHLVHRPWMKFADVAAWVNTRIIMILLFYLVILPIGFIMRLFIKIPIKMIGLCWQEVVGVFDVQRLACFGHIPGHTVGVYGHGKA